MTPDPFFARLDEADDAEFYAAPGGTPAGDGTKARPWDLATALGQAAIRPGDFLAITSVKGPDGSLTAYEVRRFPKPISPGHRPFDGRDDQTMTNATVGAMVQSANGRELAMTYEGGAQKIVLPENASISTLVPGSRAQLVAGAPVNLTMDANRIALRIQVGPKP